MLTTAPKGVADILPSEVGSWQYIERTFRSICSSYGIKEIRVPTFEHTELFNRGVGAATDIVQKEMYTFEDKGGRSITLRPEGTASVARAFIENGLLSQAMPAKLYYLSSPMFRYERTQAGRLREFHQFGVEIFGAEHPSADAEIVALAMESLRSLGLRDLVAHINSIGCDNCRPKYTGLLREYISSKKESFCKNCIARTEINPLRVFDCKEESCKAALSEAPKIIDSICDDCSAKLLMITDFLKTVNVSFVVDPLVVRGLDYYTGFVFEITSPDIGSQSALCGGGRYDSLVSDLGGPRTPALGFAIGMERLLMAMKAKKISLEDTSPIDVYVATMGTEATLAAFKMIFWLRRGGVACEMDLLGRSLKSQFKYADKLNAPYVIIIGETELIEQKYILRNMKTGEEKKIYPSENIARLVKPKT